MSSSLKRFFLVCFSLIVVGAVAAGGAAFYGYNEFTRQGPVASDGAEETIILVERGSGLSRIARQLEAEGLISNPLIFKVVIRLRGDSDRLKAGEYAIPSGSSMAEIALIFQEGKSIQYRVTIAEGLTSAQAVKVLMEDEVLVGDIKEVPAEGVLLPETYLFTRGTTRAELLSRMKLAQSNLLEDLWTDRAFDLPLNSKYEAIVLASIVEKETAIPEERPRIAAVFVNRLRRGIKLQSDPTIIYGLTRGEPLGRGIRQSELKKDTGYNTYIIDGLPPTPIANPGADSIRAVLNPPETQELFFVADGTGGHIFAKTLAEHNRNVAQWRRIERRQRATP